MDRNRMQQIGFGILTLSAIAVVAPILIVIGIILILGNYSGTNHAISHEGTTAFCSPTASVPEEKNRQMNFGAEWSFVFQSEQSICH